MGGFARVLPGFTATFTGRLPIDFERNVCDSVLMTARILINPIMLLSTDPLVSRH